MDVGSFRTRAGWSGEVSPRLDFRSLVKKSSEMSFVGNDLEERLLWEQGAVSPFDGEIIHRFDLFEKMLDYCFYHLGVTGNRVEHPLIMSEVLCCPAHVRRFTSELCFESYSVPSVLYSPDCGLSYYKHSPTLPDGISITSGFYTTRICPFLNHRLFTNKAKRVDLGGFHATDHLFRLINAKQPEIGSKLDVPKLIDIKHNHCYVAKDYREELIHFAPDLDKDGFIPGTCVPRYYKFPENIVMV